MSKRIIVTGATGYIGRNIIKQALELNYKVICLVNSNSSRIDSIIQHEDLEVIKCSMSEYAELKIAEKCDIFFHLAWAKTAGAGRDDANSQIKNIQHTIDAIYLAKRSGCSVFVGAGSQAEYGVVENGVKLSPTTPCDPSSGYGIAKYAAGKLGAMTAKQLEIKFNWVRILSIYGVGDSSNSLISYAVNELKYNRKPSFTRCEQQWDYLNVEDASSAFWAVAQHGKDGQTYALGSGKPRQLKEYIDEIYKLTGADCGIGFGDREYYPHQPMYMVADIKRLTDHTDWKPKVDFVDGIKKML